MMTIVANPRNYKIPEWFLNRQKDHKTGRFSQVRPARGCLFAETCGGRRACGVLCAAHNLLGWS